MLGGKTNKRIEKLSNDFTKENEKYKELVDKLNREYERECDKYNERIGGINVETRYLRDEINKLYKVLNDVGAGSIQKITIFDYKQEDIAPSLDKELLPPPVVVDIPEESPLLYIQNPIMGLVRHKITNDALDRCEIYLNQIKLEYDKDLKDRKNSIEEIKTATEIADSYANIVSMVRDTVKNEIIPELDLISAFMYADVIRERIYDDAGFDNIKPNNILVYQGTDHDIHYQFVKNTVDFYTLCVTFFTDTPLTDILDDKVVTEEEKRKFQEDIDNIKKSSEELLRKKAV